MAHDSNTPKTSIFPWHCKTGSNRGRKLNRISIRLLFVALKSVALMSAACIIISTTLYLSSTTITINNSTLDQWMMDSATIKDSSTSGGRKIVEHLAIVRPFAPKEKSTIVNTFKAWKDYTPCHGGHRGDAETEYAKVDFFLSYSQSLHDAVQVKEKVERMIASFRSDKNASPWNGCINEIYAIDAHIAPKDDMYLKHMQGKDKKWVNGPNQHFLTTLSEMRDGVYGTYEAVFIMEKDMVPVRKYWLDSLLEEMEETNFAMLGR